MRLIINPILAGNAFRERFDNPISIKSLLLFGAVVAIFVGFGIALSIARSKIGEKKAQNIEEFYEDEVLETKRLERTLSIALVAVAVVAVAIAAYYVWEPTRQAKMTTSFETRSVRRGQTLYANVSMAGYNNVQSLGCADCHGGYDPETGRYANGGTATYTLKALKDPESDPACADDKKFTNPDCITTSVSWKAPALNTVLYKYPIRKTEAGKPFTSSCRLEDQRTTADCRSQVFDILTYGRPGTPMPAWGVAGGGPKNEQALNDLVNFLAAIQLPADEAPQPLRSGAIIIQKKKVDTAEQTLKTAKEDALENGVPQSKLELTTSVVTANETLNAEKAKLKEIESKTENEYIREQAISEAKDAITAAQKVVDEEAPLAVASAQSQYDDALQAYKAESVFVSIGNPQDYLDKIETEQTEIKIEKRIEEAKLKKNKSAANKADAELEELRRLKNVAQNVLESRDALAVANATQRVFAPESLKNAKARLTQLESESDGQLLFEYNCARCHTKGWSYFTPGNARIPLPAPQGTGGFGPNLSGGNVVRQFTDAKDQVNFIASGSIFQGAYGAGGIGSGRMPGFNATSGRVLEDSQIEAIVKYEREGLSGEGHNSLGVENLGSGILSSQSSNQGDK